MNKWRGVVFLKFYEKLEHAKSLMNGELHCGTIKSFRVPEAGMESMRYDNYDSLKEKMSIKDVHVKFEDEESIKIKAKNGVLKIYEPDAHIFCMYSMMLPLVSRENPMGETFKMNSLINKKTTNLGDHVVFILESQTFLDKVDKTIRNKNFEGFRGHINYYDQNTYDGKSGYGYFRKPDTHKHQSEYRYVIHSNEPKTKALTMNIGSLGSIAKLYETKELLNKSITVIDKDSFEIS
ncbi:MAG: hypothetical protein ACI35O_10285 [Bacillaceae bacterium]